MSKHSKIRVVFCPNDFIVGGVQRLHLNLFGKLDPDHYDMHLVTLFEFPHKQVLFDEIPPFVTVHRLSFSGFKDVRSWFVLYRLLRELKPDVVIASLFFANTVCRILNPLLGYPVIATENNTYVKKSRTAILVDRLLSHVTYKIIAVSETVRTFTAAQEKIPLEKFMVIRSGVDVEAIARAAAASDKDATRRELGFDQKDVVAINVARLTSQKNQGALIEAFAEFSPAHPTYKLLILGEGSKYEQFAKRIQELRMEDTIKLLGSVTDVPRYYGVSDFFVSPSHIEGFGLAHVEAFSAGLPVLTTKTAGPDEMIQEGKNGFFIADASPSAIGDGLEKMISLNLVSMREACRATADRYSIRHTAVLYEELIRGATHSAI